MVGKFIGPGVDLETAYVNDYSVIDEQAMTGSLWLWGINNYGQLGTNNTTNHSSPVQTIATGTNWEQVSVSLYNTAAIKTDGTLWTWGFNNSGQLGNNATTNRSSPVQTIANVATWKLVSCGSYHMGAIKTDGTLWLWGRNAYGELGNNTTTNRSSPVQTIAAGTNWKQVACGSSVSAAIKTNGSLWLWGKNGYGTLGNNNPGVDASSPVQTIAAGTNWKKVSIDGPSAAAVKTDGTLWTWGANYNGQLGDNTTINRSSPVQTISRGTNWKDVSMSESVTVGLKTDGTLWTWGSANTPGGNNFQLGDGTSISKSSPVQTISGGTNWIKISDAGLNPSGGCGIKSDGTLWLWGTNSYGQCGTNTLNFAGTGISSPVQTITSGTNWKQISRSSFTTAGVFFYDAGKLYPSS